MQARRRRQGSDGNGGATARARGPPRLARRTATNRLSRVKLGRNHKQSRRPIRNTAASRRADHVPDAVPIARCQSTNANMPALSPSARSSPKSELRESASRCPSDRATAYSPTAPIDGEPSRGCKSHRKNDRVPPVGRQHGLRTGLRQIECANRRWPRAIWARESCQ